MKKAKIRFNDIEKVVEITEEFHTEFRILGEMSDIWNEESKALAHLKKYKDIPFSSLPKEVRTEIFEETAADASFDKLSKKYEKSLIKVIEDSFSIKVKANNFFNESYEPSKEDVANGIVIFEVCNDK